MYRVVICLCFIAINSNIAERIYVSDSEYIVPEFPPGILSIIRNVKYKEKALDSTTNKAVSVKSGETKAETVPVVNVKTVVEPEVDDRDYTVPDLTLNDLFNYSANEVLDNDDIIEKRDTNSSSYLRMLKNSKESVPENVYFGNDESGKMFVDDKGKKIEEELIKFDLDGLITQSELEAARSFDVMEYVTKNLKGNESEVRLNERIKKAVQTAQANLTDKNYHEQRIGEDLRTFDLDALISQSELEAGKTFDVMELVAKDLKENESDINLNGRIKQAVRMTEANSTGPNKEALMEIVKKINDTYHEKLPDRNNIRTHERVKPKDDFDNFFRSRFHEEFPENIYKSSNIMKNLTDIVNAMPEFKETPKILEPKYLKIIENGPEIEVGVTDRSAIEGAKFVKKIIRSPIDELGNAMMRTNRKSTNEILKNFDSKLVFQRPVNVELDTILKLMRQQKPSPSTQADVATEMTKPSQVLIESYQEPNQEEDDHELNDLIFNKLVL